MKISKIAVPVILSALGLGMTSIESAVAAMPRHHDGELFSMEKIHNKLHLTPEQEKTWQSLEQQRKEMFKASWEQRKALRARIKSELDRGEPDLAALAAETDRSMDEQIHKRRQLRDQWLKLYAQLSPEQKAIVKDAIKARMDKSERMREKFRHHREKEGNPNS